MVYADNVVIMGRRLQDVEEVLRILVEKTNKMGLEIVEKRQNFLWYHKSLTTKTNVCKFGAHTYNFETAKGYTYLGTTADKVN